MNQDDEQQLQQIKAWWQRYGSGILLGLAGLAVILAGWWGYGTWQERSAQQAAAAYAELLRAEQGGELAAAEAAGERILDEHAGSGYAAMAALRLARIQVEAGERRRAVQTLKGLADSADSRAMAELARLRRARLLGETDQEAALSLLEGEVTEGFRASYAQLRGDLLSQLGRAEAAVAAYREALNSEPGLGGRARELVRRKLQAMEAEA